MGPSRLINAVALSMLTIGGAAHAQVTNLTTGQTFQSIAEALRTASPGDELLADEKQFQIETPIDFNGLAVKLRSTGRIEQPAGFQITLAPDAALQAATGSSAAFRGTVRIPADNPTSIEADGLLIDAEGSIQLDPGAWLIVGSPGALIDGRMDLPASARAQFEGDLFVGDALNPPGVGDRATLGLGPGAEATIGGAFVHQPDGLLSIERNQIAGANTTPGVLAFGQAGLFGGLELTLAGVAPSLGDRFRLIEAESVEGAFGVTLVPTLAKGLRVIIRAEGAGTQVNAVVEQTAASPAFDPPEIAPLAATPSDAVVGVVAGAGGPNADLIVTAPDTANGGPGRVIVLSDSAAALTTGDAPARNKTGALLSGESPAALGLEPVSETVVGANPVALAVGDFNADAVSDTAVVNKDDDTLTILLGDGEGNLIEHDVIPTGDGPNDVSAADLDEDGDLDLIVANEFDGSIMIFENDGGANFTLIDTVAAGEGRPKSADPSEVDGDGKTDIVVTESIPSLRAGTRVAPDGRLSVLRNDGAGGFEPAVTFAGGFDPFRATLADLNLDGRIDVVIGNRGVVLQPDGSRQAELSIFLNDSAPGSVQFLPAVQAPVGQDLTSLAAVDLDGDADPDIAIVAGEPRQVSILRNDFEPGAIGGVTLADIQPIDTEAEPFLLTAGDLDADGDDDLIVIGAAQQTGAGDSLVESFANAAPIPQDLNGDGVVDGADLGLLLGAWGEADGPADFNGDGVVDGADLGLLLGAWSA